MAPANLSEKQRQLLIAAYQANMAYFQLIRIKEGDVVQHSIQIDSTSYPPEGWNPEGGLQWKYALDGLHDHGLVAMTLARQGTYECRLTEEGRTIAKDLVAAKDRM